MLVLQRHASLATAALEVMGQVLRLRFILFGLAWGMPSPVSLQLSNKERRRCHTVDDSEVLHVLHAKAYETWDIPQASSGDRRISEP